MPDDARGSIPLPPALRQWIAENLLRGLPRDRIVARIRAAARAQRAVAHPAEGPAPAGRHGSRGPASIPSDEAADGIAHGTAAGIVDGGRGGGVQSDGTAPAPDPAAIARAVAAIDESPTLAAARQASRRLRQLEAIHRLGRALAETADDPERVPRRAELTAAQFYAEHYAAWQPVVLPGFAATWPARRWTPEALAERFGAVEVAVTDDRERDPDYDMNTARHTRRVTLAAFVERIRAAGPSNDCYMVAQNRVLEDPAMAPLMDDVPFDPAWFRPDRWRGCSALWLGPAGTVTPLHHDTCNIMFVQLYGRKRVTLASPLETTLLDGARSMYAAVDPEREADAARFRRVVLEPGDAIFLPVGWWHHVRALDVSISLALTNFRASNSFDWYRPGAVR